MRKQIYRYPLALFAAGLLAACSGDKNEGTDKEGVETVLPPDFVTFLGSKN